MTALFDPQPIISPEQAAADRAAFLEMAKDPIFQKTVWQRKRLKPTEPPKPSEGIIPRGDTAEKIERAQELRDAGWSDKAIAKEVNISNQTITRYLGPNQNTRTQRLSKAESERRIALAIHQRREGRSQAEIAAALDVSQQTVCNWFKARGIA